MSDDPQMLAYLAGLIDGQGNVTTLSKGADRPDAFTVFFESSYESLAQLLQEHLGGSCITKYANIQTRGTKYEWRTTNSDAWHVYAKLLPYLRVKNQFKVPNPIPAKWARINDHSL